MKKPQPTARVMIMTDMLKDPMFTRDLLIFTADAAAHDWIAEHAPQFGDFSSKGNCQLLVVLPLYDRDEVISYLKTLGE